jgi:hypothetical protein
LIYRKIIVLLLFLTTDIIGAIQAAQVSVGANSVVKEAELTHAHNYLVYKIMVVDENMKK